MFFSVDTNTHDDGTARGRCCRRLWSMFRIRQSEVVVTIIYNFERSKFKFPIIHLTQLFRFPGTVAMARDMPAQRARFVGERACSMTICFGARVSASYIAYMWTPRNGIHHAGDVSGPPCHGGKYEEGAYFTLHYPALSAAPPMMNEPMNRALEGMKILVHRLHETDIFVYPYPFEKKRSFGDFCLFIKDSRSQTRWILSPSRRVSKWNPPIRQVCWICTGLSAKLTIQQQQQPAGNITD